MNLSLDCFPCLIRQALDATRLATSDKNIHRLVIQEVLKWPSTLDLDQPPIILAQRIHRYVREITGVEDPYHAAKSHLNNLVMSLVPELARMISSSDDPLMLAVRLAIAGNVIDLGMNSAISERDIRLSINQSLKDCILAEQHAFKQALKEAETILYLADNAGEIVFDRLLIEQISPLKVTLAVRGAPVINDATLTDARAVGLLKHVNVISNGSDAPGTLLNDCSKEFLRYYNEANMVIAKGQGNYESLSDETREIFFLLKVKCPVISDHIGFPLGSNVLTRSNKPYITRKAS